MSPLIYPSIRPSIHLFTIYLFVYYLPTYPSIYIEQGPETKVYGVNVLEFWKNKNYLC